MFFPTVNADRSTMEGTRGGRAMSRAKLREPRTKLRPPVSTAALSAVGFRSGAFVGASASTTFSAAKRIRRSLRQSSRASSIRRSTVRPVARYVCMSRRKTKFSAHAGSLKRRSRLSGATSERPTATLPSSAASRSDPPATASGRSASFAAVFAAARPGRKRRSGPSAASVRRTSSGSATPAGSGGEGASAAGAPSADGGAPSGAGSDPARRGPRAGGAGAATGLPCRLLGDGDLALEDLARRGLRQLVQEPDPARILVGGDAVLDERADLLGARLLPWLQHDGRRDLLAHRLVGHADHRRLGDRRVLVQDLLDLARIDVVAAADDHVLLAVDDEEVAILVELRHVAGVEPAPAHDLLRRVGPAPVALHDVVAADADLADLAL